METGNKRMIIALATVGAALVLAFFLSSAEPKKKVASWKTETEGYLAVATPCCTEASLWDSLDTLTTDGQRARPATVAEAARWLNHWPYQSREDRDEPGEAPLPAGAQSNEIRCTGQPTGDPISQYSPDEEILESIRQRNECTYARWKIWSEGTAEGIPNERHTIWVDDEGFFHGRVDYWLP